MRRPCPLCDGRPGAAWFPFATEWDNVRFDYVLCRDCGATFVDPAPSDDQLARIYTWDAYHGREYAAPDPAPYRASVAMLARVRPAPAHLLDFGCGGGGFLVAAREAGYQCEGVEYDAGVAARVSVTTGVPVWVVDDLPTTGPRFDVIVLRDVLPHLVDPTATLRSLERVLGPGGDMFLDGPLEEQASLVRVVSHGMKALQRLARHTEPATFAPTMLFRVDAAAQRQFLIGRMGYRERVFRVYETGWPYRVRGRRSCRPDLVIKQVVGSVAVLAAAAGRTVGLHLGNRFYGVYRVGR